MLSSFKTGQNCLNTKTTEKTTKENAKFRKLEIELEILI